MTSKSKEVVNKFQTASIRGGWALRIVFFCFLFFLFLFFLFFLFLNQAQSASVPTNLNSNYFPAIFSIFSIFQLVSVDKKPMLFKSFPLLSLNTVILLSPDYFLLLMATRKNLNRYKHWTALVILSTETSWKPAENI